MYCPNTKFSLSLLLLSTSGKSNCLLNTRRKCIIQCTFKKKMIKSYLLFVFIAIHFICKKSFTIFTLFCFVFWIFSSQLDKILKKKKRIIKCILFLLSLSCFIFIFLVVACSVVVFVVIPKGKGVLLNAPSAF